MDPNRLQHMPYLHKATHQIWNQSIHLEQIILMKMGIKDRWLDGQYTTHQLSGGIIFLKKCQIYLLHLLNSILLIDFSLSEWVLVVLVMITVMFNLYRGLESRLNCKITTILKQFLNNQIMHLFHQEIPNLIPYSINHFHDHVSIMSLTLHSNAVNW